MKCFHFESSELYEKYKINEILDKELSVKLSLQGKNVKEYFYWHIWRLKKIFSDRRKS